MRKLLVGIAFVSMLVFAFTGCGGRTSDATVNSDATANQAEQEEQEPVYIPEDDTSEEADTVELVLSIDGETLDVSWEDNNSVFALMELVESEPLEVQMSMYGDFEQVGSLGANLPQNDERITTGAGDIVLYQGNQIVVFYGSNTWSYTKLGRIEGKTAEELAELLGAQDVTIRLLVAGSEPSRVSSGSR